VGQLFFVVESNCKEVRSILMRSSVVLLAYGGY
jgi:hypothetical protein